MFWNWIKGAQAKILSKIKCPTFSILLKKQFFGEYDTDRRDDFK